MTEAQGIAEGIGLIASVLGIINFGISNMAGPQGPSNGVTLFTALDGYTGPDGSSGPISNAGGQIPFVEFRNVVHEVVQSNWNNIAYGSKSQHVFGENPSNRGAEIQWSNGYDTVWDDATKIILSPETMPSVLLSSMWLIQTERKVQLSAVMLAGGVVSRGTGLANLR